MNHRQRIETCLAGREVDRPPVSLWRHFPVDDQDPYTLAQSILLFQHIYDFDFIKITPASSYCVNDYGVQDEWKGNPEGTREYASYPVKSPSDWKGLKVLSPTEGSLASQLECVRLVKKGLSDNTPVIQTIFDPMSQAKNLVGRENLLVHMRQYPEDLLIGLETITRNTIAFVTECIQLGIDGIFFAIQHAQASLLTREEVGDFIFPFDEQILNSASSLWMNVAHLHGKDLYFNDIPKKGIAIINWHDQETPPSLPVAKQEFSGAVCGGLRQWDTLVYGSPKDVTSEARLAINATDGNRFILGTGCVLPIIAPHSNILAARMAVEKV